MSRVLTCHLVYIYIYIFRYLYIYIHHLTLCALCACDFMSILSNFQQKDPCPLKKTTHLPTVFVSPFWSPCVICPLHLQHQWNRFTTFFHRLENFEWIQMTHETAAGYTVRMEWKHVDFLKTFCRKPFFPPQTNLQTPDWSYWLHFWAIFFEALEQSAMILACCAGLSWISKSLPVFSCAKLPRDEALEVIVTTSESRDWGSNLTSNQSLSAI